MNKLSNATGKQIKHGKHIKRKLGNMTKMQKTNKQSRN